MRKVVTETSRLVVRPLAPGDLDAYAALNADPEVMRYMGGRVRTREETAAEIMCTLYAYEEHGYGFWAVERKSDGAWLGRAGLLQQELDDGAHVELAYGYARAYWGQGYATEAAVAIRDHAFGSLDIPQLISIVHVANAPSQRVAEKAGLRFRRETVFRGFDVHVYGLRREAGRSADPRG
jgi:[ribosomal protein S5]-alanine N-acetyltransferase